MFLISILSATALIGLLLGLKFLISITLLSFITLPLHLRGLKGLIGVMATFFESSDKIGP